MKNFKIAYIGGGSKQWARTFMTDLALSEGLSGEIGLYDIDIEAAKRNQQIGQRINQNPKTLSQINYKVYEKIEDCLKDATFVVISILPGTFEEMRSDVHAPEEYGIYQSVGDTAGPGGVLRAMRTVPIYEVFARKIKEICPKAWVINFTNPMSICVKTLYDVFPEIKAFGCCHEVFHAQAFLCLVLGQELGIKATRKDIYTDASGVNHFTWITEAKYKDIDLLKLLPSFMEKYYEDGYYEYFDRFQFETDCFAYGNKVKMNMFKRYGILAAAGDRHLAEFVNPHWYLTDPQTVKDWKFNLTTVDFRVHQMEERINESKELASGKKEINLVASGEEATDLMKAILGHKVIISNVNLPNQGQCPQLPLGSIVETNCIFENDQVKPIVSKPLSLPVLHMVERASNNIDALYEGIKKRDFSLIFACFMNQALCSTLSIEDGEQLFKRMIQNTRNYLEEYYPNLDDYLHQ
ncbi:MAG: alpha-glucosidase/alpha-galactosidase [Anaeroplasmataceae bacterium]|nr:alpha-glucosidase/alpha-galactosidase [Anaeroplasmataceae bacterium]